MTTSLRASLHCAALDIEAAVLELLGELAPSGEPLGWCGRRPAWLDRSRERCWGRRRRWRR